MTKQITQLIQKETAKSSEFAKSLYVTPDMVTNQIDELRSQIEQQQKSALDEVKFEAVTLMKTDMEELLAKC